MLDRENVSIPDTAIDSAMNLSKTLEDVFNNAMVKRGMEIAERIDRMGGDDVFVKRLTSEERQRMEDLISTLKQTDSKQVLDELDSLVTKAEQAE